MSLQANSGAEIDTGEDALVQRYFAPLTAGLEAAGGLRDDAAIIELGRDAGLVVSADTLAAGVHFFPDDAPRDIAHKALAVNISDLVAKGAEPAWYVVCLSFAQGVEEAWLAAFCEGLGAAQSGFGCTLIGGDTVSHAGNLVISITAFGQLAKGSTVRRSGGMPGDVLFVTGTIGDAALGLRLRANAGDEMMRALAPSERDALLAAYLRPSPPLPAAGAIRQFANASMDISDGLVKDAGRLCRASACGATIQADKVPLSKAARELLHEGRASLEALLTGGDDYQILAAIAAGSSEEFRRAAQRAGVSVTQIGKLRAEPGLVVLSGEGKTLSFAREGFDHSQEA